MTTSVYLHGKNRRILNMEEIDEEYDDGVNEVHHKLGLFMGEASAWILDEVENVYVSITSYNPIRGSCHIKLPKNIAR